MNRRIFLMRLSRPALGLAIFSFAVCVLALFPLVFVNAQSSADPWTAAQTIQAPDFANELAAGKSNPTILFVGFQRLYIAGHIKGAQFHGSGGRPEGIESIKKWADPLPRSTNLVLYCGCCPMEKCPNIRPAFSALREMGFTNLRVLVLPNSFAIDWAEKGLPYDKG
jgi:thiosulfate/3-mercaptopyruvate sulfurtransferase